MRKFLKRLLLWFFLLTAPGGFAVVHADGGPGDGGGCDGTGTDPDNPCPIDGGLAILLVAGVAYGARRYRDGRKEKGGETDVQP